MNYCAQCGYKLEGEFRFCPNCGFELKSSNNSAAAEGNIKEVIICKNCGEENSLDSINCFSCGVPLKGHKNSKQASGKFEDKKNNQKKSDDGEFTKRGNIKSEEKILDNKKILIISSFVVIVFVIALLITGVFESGVQSNMTQVNNQSNASGVNLENMNEITDLENKLKANPDDMEATLHLAHLQQDSKLFEKAISNYKKYLEKNPENADALVDMGICFYNLGDYKSAINEMESALKYQPKHQIACLNLGIVNLAAQNIAESKKWFKKTVELNPNSEAGKRAQELLTSH
ncbi:MAG: tetratricopeptide repeat protein [Ignavibacteriaceae bacterium]|jgi:tetratricopeptide (TPR) repeat protein|nr:tetratricopeptide repeat protein [Ignavibacteriaceae bacterium]MCW8813298.1 tetratricopeptide repeat protein [Chlorobium sp.]MCW8817882.1 tetratricopeptide repeat protein [Ignavibacteriaceae bacterium]MCW8823593.1 tetratricopeptide repeat protein [Ignavibacteriaceae bacterium]MCW9094704.1 tetratricopeptide repeat protein [Ignavibacteriaceae bacterium]